MIRIVDLIGTLSNYLERQRQLDGARRRATGDVDYYSYGYIQGFNRAERELEQALNAYIDQRVAEKLEPLHALST